MYGVRGRYSDDQSGPLQVMLRDTWRLVGPSPANALDGETLMLAGGQLIVLGGIEALRPGQTCVDAQGTAYPCGDEATRFLQSLVQDSPVICFVTYPNIGVCSHPRGRRRPAIDGRGSVHPDRPQPENGERRLGVSRGRRNGASRRVAGRGAAQASGRLARFFRAAAPLGRSTAATTRGHSLGTG